MARIRAVSLAALLVLVALVSGAPGAWAQDFPKLTGRVVDAANIIPDAEEAQLTQKLEALEKQSKRQLVVATVPSLNGYEISDYGYQLGRAWGIGQKDTNNGAILLVAPNERKVRIEVGYGLEGTLTDGLSFLIINNQILPRFKADDYPGGIAAGTDAIIKQLTLPPDEARKIAAEADKAQKERGGGVSIGTVIFILFVIFFFVLPIIRSASGGRRGRYGGLNTPIIWFPGGFGGDDDDDHGGWGGFGGGGGGWGGGGGFSGGGGSFGGGGASGSW
ncbi:TPM domain-containing protein [Novosphingobium guangzhouense]|uniref:Methanol dehydrogenase n=1 Tax=Novosphingobium guangzhouense TaxID=1850347 RepID=A0A2K2G6A5_9SPHN|nr:TPM domain-containing protein [Novosphingobium guangzhouense]PNU06560.1 methanol dehydrogenase [Novosphingobium guangzhouense]